MIVKTKKPLPCQARCFVCSRLLRQFDDRELVVGDFEKPDVSSVRPPEDGVEYPKVFVTWFFWVRDDDQTAAPLPVFDQCVVRDRDAPGLVGFGFHVEDDFFVLHRAMNNLSCPDRPCRFSADFFSEHFSSP